MPKFESFQVAFLILLFGNKMDGQQKKKKRNRKKNKAAGSRNRERRKPDSVDEFRPFAIVSAR